MLEKLKNFIKVSVKEALSYEADTFMLYTGAPQNTRRKAIDELNIDAGWELMKKSGLTLITEKTVLPDEGQDGAFAALCQKLPL